jgi:hypothetical protein
MGHIRLKRLPATRKWQHVVALLADGAPVEEIASASADAADSGLEHGRDDPTLAHAVWLLTQIPLAARAPDFAEAARSLGLDLRPEPTLMEVVGAYSEAVDSATRGRTGRTDFGEMAQSAAAESLATVAGADLPELFGATPADVRLALGKLAAPDRFCPARAGLLCETDTAPSRLLSEPVPLKRRGARPAPCRYCGPQRLQRSA